jgi:WhiB family transcriptional regulator, redox-sensing transcriptional regulator
VSVRRAMFIPPLTVPASQREPEDWRLDAACRDEDSELFFHPEGENGAAKQRRIRDAKAVCGRCTVSLICLEKAVAKGEAYGIFGNTTPEERHPLIVAARAERRAARAVAS